MLVSICKSLDFLLGFLVGKLSDSTRTRWGRRKPWIAAFSPLFIVVTLLLASPGLFFSTTADKDAVAGASTCASHATKGALNCTALKQCLDVEIAAGSLPAWDSAALGADGAASASSYSTGLAVRCPAMHYCLPQAAAAAPATAPAAAPALAAAPAEPSPPLTRCTSRRSTSCTTSSDGRPR